MTHPRPGVVVTTYVRSGSDQVRHAVVLPGAPTRRTSEPLSRYDRLDPAPRGRSRVNVDVEGLDRLREAMAAMAQQVNASRFSTEELAEALGGVSASKAPACTSALAYREVV